MLGAMFESLERPNNGIRNMNAVYTTGALLLAELLCEETLPDFVRLVLSLQDLALTSASLSAPQKIQLHVLALSLFALLAHCLPYLQLYSNKVSKLNRFLTIYFNSWMLSDVCY
jgi:hypothetical protein